jgi:hypothetical protein
MTKVRMTHPQSGGTYDAEPMQVPHLRATGWLVDEDQDTSQVEEWPQDLQRFGGQPGVRIYHPETGGETDVPQSAWPFWERKGWLRADGDDRSLEDLTVAELKEQIGQVNKTRADDDQLSVSGTKAELVERLRFTPAAEADAGDEPAQDKEE